MALNERLNLSEQNWVNLSERQRFCLSADGTAPSLDAAGHRAGQRDCGDDSSQIAQSGGDFENKCAPSVCAILQRLSAARDIHSMPQAIEGHSLDYRLNRSYDIP